MKRLRPAAILLLASALGCTAAAAGETPPPPPVSVRFGGFLQAQADGGDRGDSRFPGSEVRFYLRRARASATAAFSEGFEARLEAELAGTLAATTSLRAQLTDAYVGWTRHAATQVRAGQFKTPFGHEQLASDARLATIERSLGSDRLTPGRQVGVQLHGELAGRRLSYAVGAFNGTGANATGNEDGELLVAARLSGRAWSGTLGGATGTLSVGANGFASDDERLSLAADFGFDSPPATAAADGLFTGRRRGAGADVQLVAGRLEAQAEALLVRFEPGSAVPSSSFDATSVAVQAGWELLPKRLHLVAKLDRFDPNGDRSGDATTTLTVGGSLFLRGHDLKLQASYLGSAVPGLPRQHKVLARIQAAF